VCVCGGGGWKMANQTVSVGINIETKGAWVERTGRGSREEDENY